MDVKTFWLGGEDSRMWEGTEAMLKRQMGHIERERGRKKREKMIVLGCVCVCFCNRGRIIGCGQERNSLSVCRGVGLCPPSLWLQPHLPCILKRQNAESWTQLLTLHQSSRLTLTCCTHKTFNRNEGTHHHKVATHHWINEVLCSLC